MITPDHGDQKQSEKFVVNDAVADDVIVKDGQRSQLDLAVLACAKIDLYSQRRPNLRARSSRVSFSGLQAISEAKENDGRIDNSGVSIAQHSDEKVAAQASDPHLSDPLPILTPGLKTSLLPLQPQTTARLRSMVESGGPVRRKASGKSFRRSFSAPLGSALSQQGKRGKHRRHPTDPPSRLLRSAISGPVKGGDAAAAAVVVAPKAAAAASSVSKAPNKQRRSHKRMQSMDLTNDPASCSLVPLAGQV
jgi:hypothetical protein